MKVTRANTAGLSSPLQQAEMKSILAGAWPPLKPLPVFKYETPEYRATIDFDKKRGEWVCRKISLPSNTIQELRGGLREITLALPHGEAEIFTEDAEPQEHELEKDTQRRLQALHEWRENYESGALYFELRDHLSESQRAEIDDSLRLSLTARQLQFNPKNVAYVFDALSTAGGRFAVLLECAKRNKAKQGTDLKAQGGGVVPEGERASEHDEQPLEISCREFGGLAESRIVRDQEAAECSITPEELPAVSIQNVLPEQEQPSLAERMVHHDESQQFEIEASPIEDEDSRGLIEHPSYQEADQLPAFAGFPTQVQRGHLPADPIEGSSSHFPALEISAIQVAVFSALFLSAVFAFIVGLTVGRGPLASRLLGAPKAMLGMDSKSPALPDQTSESNSRSPAPLVASSNDSRSGSRVGDATASEGKPTGNARESEKFTEVRSTDSDSSGTVEAKPSAKPEANSEHSGAIEPIAPRSPAPRRPTSTIGTAPNLPSSSTILVTRPSRGSQPFRVSFPEKTIAATSSLAMSSQLSVLVSAAPGPTAVHKAARLEAGELVSFVWPSYPRPGDRYGLGETIRVRATIGQLGQVREVKFLSGSSSLLPATKAAVRQWRYRPTLMDKRPVQAQQDVTIEFRPPRYSSQLSTQHSSHNY